MLRILHALAIFILLVGSSCSKGSGSNPEEKSIKPFLEKYFSTWSAKDFEGYGGCFHPSARVTFVDRSGESVSQSLTDFLHSQRISHAQANHPMSESPTSMAISGDARVAQASVRWRLIKGAESVTGTDFFTLIKTPDGWRIIALVFYND
jgi:hypothetical protein